MDNCLFMAGKISGPSRFYESWGLTLQDVLLQSAGGVPMSDKSHLILTAVGPDQVGLVEKISEFISRRGCNIDDSKMAVFCGEFAVIVLITGAGAELQRLAAAVRELEIETGLTFSIKTPAERRTGESLLPYKLVASCMDHPGIVHKLSRELSRLGITFESIET